MKKRCIILLFLAVAAAVGSCVYSFDPQIDGEGGYLVVDGNIVIGEVSEVRLSYSWSLVDTLATQDEARMAVLYQSRMHVEDSEGGRYDDTQPFGNRSALAYFDMREADPALSYRLVIENPEGTYVSAWEKPFPPGEIDELKYDISADGSTMRILVSAHSDTPAPSYYRWQVDETWEYHARTYSYVNYYYTGRPDGRIEQGPDTVYRCWSDGVLGGILTASTEDLAEDRVVDHQLYTIGNHDQRVSVCYAADVRQMRIPEEAYRYWNQMNDNASDIGGLFSPEPSEYRGNVTNTDDPEELVLGYVGVLSVASRRLYVRHDEARFYRAVREPELALDTLRSPAEYLKAYMEGKVPVTEVFSETGFSIGFEWWPVGCVDCRYQGGTTKRPPEWPI